MASRASITRTVCLTELRLLLRDRRAFLLAIVLPMWLFPLLFFGMDALKKGSVESQQSSPVKVGYDLGNLPTIPYYAIIEELERKDLQIELSGAGRTKLGLAEPWSVRGHDGQPDPEEWRAEAQDLLQSLDLLVVARRELREQGDFEEAYSGVRLIYDGSNTQSNEAHRRVSEALGKLRATLLLDGLRNDLGNDPGAFLSLERVDLASAENAAGHKLGGMLPIILVLIVISSASFAALGAFAGEREEGTIETLLVQPVGALDVARGKFIAVLLVACAAALGNGGSFVLSLFLGLGQGSSSELAIGISAMRVGLGLLHFLPTAVFLSALLTLISARARSFREGQHYVLPIVLGASLLASVSTQDSIPSNLVFALVPISGPTLVLRDTLAGQFSLLPALVSFLASCGWSWLLLKHLAQTLDAERLFKNPEAPGEAARRKLQSRRALGFGLLSIVLIYVVGGRLQSADLIRGLMATLWILVPCLAVLCARAVAKQSGESLGEALGLVRAQGWHLLGALLLSPALVVLLTALLSWQSSFLPFPRSLEVPGALLELSPLALVFVAAISPGITEELLFRGAILGGQKKDLSTLQIAAWQGLLFGAVHASIYRFLPSALLGAIFALLTLRARSLWPAILAHASYNAIQVLDLPLQDWWHPQGALGLGMLGVGLLWFNPSSQTTRATHQPRS